MKIPQWVFYSAAIVIICLFSFLIGRCSKDSQVEYSKSIDTVYVDKIKLVEVIKPVLPNRVLIQKEVDSLVLIRLSERKKEVIGIEKKPGKKNTTYLNIQTINRDSLKIHQNEYAIPANAAFKVDSEGNISYDESVAKRQAVWKTVKDLMKAIGIAITFFLLGQVL